MSHSLEVLELEVVDVKDYEVSILEGDAQRSDLC